jgi:hypothetical protein
MCNGSINLHQWDYPLIVFSTFRSGFFLTLLALVIQCNEPCLSQVTEDHQKVKQTDSLSNREQRDIRRTELKQSRTRCNIYAGVVFANLQTKVSFESPSGLLSANIGLEKHLGLPGQKTFFTAGLRYRFTPTSGIYAIYYGINRREERITTEDIIFLHDTIKAGKKATAWFNTQVVSVGYLLSVMQDPKAFLGLFFNVSLMNISTGVQSDIFHIDEKVKVFAPLPNFGVIADFRLYKWLHFAANIGFFSLHTDSYGGNIYDLNVGLAAKPVKWLGLSLTYQEFDVNLFFPVDKITVRADYNFRGPALGMHFIF